MGRTGNTARAIGQVLNRNPDHPLKVPCHRVVASDGRIGGYGFGGTNPKITLLEGEGVVVRDGRVQRFEQLQYSF
jgi:methylated-DNA-[protein]-cysteine S-methyltransferase